MEVFYQFVFFVFLICNIGFYLFILIQNVVQLCIVYMYDVNCNVFVMQNNVMIFYLIKVCKEYYFLFYFYEKFYKNIYCVLCEVGINDFIIQNGGGGVFGDFVIIFFIVFMNF